MPQTAATLNLYHGRKARLLHVPEQIRETMLGDDIRVADLVTDDEGGL